MNKWIRNMGVGMLSVVIVSVVFLGVENANSYANEANNYESELAHASESYENMDAQSQQQFLSSVSGVSSMDLSSMDLETALMAVQSERTKLLDSQLKEQIEEVQKRNELVAELNGELTALQEERNKLNEDEKDKVREIDAQIQQYKSQIDAQSNSQQMDMLRLQSLSNKRNEAFDTMTNFVKKMQDSRSSIIGNMR